MCVYMFIYHKKLYYIHFPKFCNSSMNVMHLVLSILTASLNNTADGSAPRVSTVTKNQEKSSRRKSGRFLNYFIITYD